MAYFSVPAHHLLSSWPGQVIQQVLYCCCGLASTNENSRQQSLCICVVPWPVLGQVKQNRCVFRVCFPPLLSPLLKYKAASASFPLIIWTLSEGLPHVSRLSL